MPNLTMENYIIAVIVYWIP